MLKTLLYLLKGEKRKMNFWFVIHDIKSYRQHADWIGCKVKDPGIQKPKYGPFINIKKDDKIVYYTKKDALIVGIFEVVSEIKYIKDDADWGEIMVFEIKPDIMPSDNYALDFKALLDDPNTEFELFMEKEKWMYQIWGHTCRPLPRSDFEQIQKSIVNRKHLKKLSSEIAEERLITKIGRPLPTIGLLYEPIDEFGVVFLFSKHHRRLGFPFILRIGREFPDATVLDENAETKHVELEFKSSNFKMHNHDPNKCDYIVCWEHDWEDFPADQIQVIELRDALRDLFGW